MRDAVAALDAAEMALAHHHTGGAEMTGHRWPRRVVDEMDLSARLAGRKVAAKYRDSATGNSWSGRGLQPNWLKAALASGRKLEEFAV